MTSVEIPNRAVFRAQEVCEITEVQPYVLRTWEAEFPNLGTSKANGPRLYRRADVERVLRIKHLILIDGLTLAGARRQLGEEIQIEGPGFVDADVAALVDGALQQQLQEVRHGLRWILDVLAGRQNGTSGELPFEQRAATTAPAGRRAAGRSETRSTAASSPKRASATPARAQKPARAAKPRAGKKR